MKRYISSGMPRLAQSNIFIFTKGKTTRKPVKTWKTVLKEQGKSRTVKVQERAKPIPAELTEWLKGIQSIAE